VNCDRFVISVYQICNLNIKLKLNNITYLFTPWSGILLEKLNGFQLVKNNSNSIKL